MPAVLVGTADWFRSSRNASTKCCARVRRNAAVGRLFLGGDAGGDA
jgi:hypothetical protein